MPDHSRENLVDCAVVGKLISQGRSNADIAELLSIRDDQVTRLTKLARKEGFLSTIHPFHDDVVREQRILTPFKQRLREISFAERLNQASWVRKVKTSIVVIDTVEPRAFERRAGQLLADMIVKAKNAHLGVMWGGVIESALRSLEEHYREHPNSRPHHLIRCIPLCGEPTGVVRNSAPRYSSSYLAAELHRIFSGDKVDHHRDEQHLLTAIPAYIPRERRDSAVTDFLWSIAGYKEIFGCKTAKGQKAGVADDLDLIVTGLGAFDPDERDDEDSITGIFLRERIELEKARDKSIAAKLRACAIGDVGGWIAPREGIDRDQQSFIKELNTGWTGAQERHFLNCAARRRKIVEKQKPDGATEPVAEKRQPSGVIAIARGAHKDQIVRYSVVQKLVNTVICDLKLARALERL